MFVHYDNFYHGYVDDELGIYVKHNANNDILRKAKKRYLFKATGEYW
jgi:hypothetical protein